MPLSICKALKNRVFLGTIHWYQEYVGRGFAGGAVVENLPANAGETGSSPGLGGSHVPRSN